MSVTLFPDARGWSAHAEQRAAERCGFVPTDFQWRRARLDILNAVAGEKPVRAILVRKEDNRGGDREHWACLLGTRGVVVVYEPSSACIITLLTPDRNLSQTIKRHYQGRHATRRRARSERYADNWEEE